MIYISNKILLLFSFICIIGHCLMTDTRMFNFLLSVRRVPLAKIARFQLSISVISNDFDLQKENIEHVILQEREQKM